MNKLFFFIFISMLFRIASGQTLQVIDKITLQPIPDVVVYTKNPQKSVLSNHKGEVNLENFKGSDSLYFSHASFESISLAIARLSKPFTRIEMTEKQISINEVIISANRWEENKIENPCQVRKIDMREASLQNPQTAADLLGSGGYVYIQKSQLAGGSPMIRGFATNRVLLVVDGVRMNNAIFRAGNLQNVISLDASMMEGTEVLFGPGAVMYGSDAIGGVMDFHTLQPKTTTGKMSVTGNAITRYATANKEKTGHADIGFYFKKIGLKTGITWSDYDDLKAGRHGNSHFLRPFYQQTINGQDTSIINKNPELQVHSGYSQLNLLQKIVWKPYDNLTFDYGFHYSATSDAPRYDRLCLDSDNDSIPDNAEWYYGPQKWMMNRIGLTQTTKNIFYDQLRFIAAVQNYEESRHDRKFNNKRRRNQTENVDAWSVNLDLDRNFGENTNLYYGAEFVLNRVASKANRIHIEDGTVTPTNTRYPDGSEWKSLGIYLNMKHKFSDKLIVNAGFRYSRFAIHAIFDTTMFPFPFVESRNAHGALNGSFGVVFNPLKIWQTYLNFSSGFRSPNIDDIGKVFDSEPGSVVVPNPRLKPEYAWNLETGSAVMISDFIKIDFAVYYTLLDDAIARRDFNYNGQDSILYDGIISRVQAMQNMTNAYVYGIQAEIEVKTGLGFGLISRLSYQKGEEKGDDGKYYPKTHLAPTFGSTHMTYQRRQLKVDFYAEYNARLDFEDLALSERNDNAPYARDANGNPYVPAWYTLNCKLAWFFTSNITINAGVENITDQLYRTYASGISATGRNFILALKCRF